MPKVSVIVPVYGVEKYIERCARSLFEQTLDDMEFIFVNDCTKDASMLVLESVIKDYPYRQSQIRILHHKVNKKLSRARETGVRFATGEYIAHCDSDDWIENNAYELLYNHAVKYGCDFVKSDHYLTDGENSIVKTVCCSEGVTKETAISYLLTCKGWNSIWDTLTKRELYIKYNVKFTDDTMLEDFFVITQLLLFSKKIGIVRQPFYYYFQNPNSICHEVNEKAVINKCYQAYRNIQFILNSVHKIYGDKFRKEEVVIKYVPRRLMIPIMTNQANYKYWRDIYKENLFDVAKSKYINFILKIQYYLVVSRIYPLYSALCKKK